MIIMAATLLAAATAECDGDTTPQVEACLSAELKATNAELNGYYQATVQRLTTEQQPEASTHLRRAEQAWTAYRDAECGAVWRYWGGEAAPSAARRSSAAEHRSPAHV